MVRILYNTFIIKGGFAYILMSESTTYFLVTFSERLTRNVRILPGSRSNGTCSLEFLIGLLSPPEVWNLPVNTRPGRRYNWKFTSFEKGSLYLTGKQSKSINFLILSPPFPSSRCVGIRADGHKCINNYHFSNSIVFSRPNN